MNPEPSDRSTAPTVPPEGSAGAPPAAAPGPTPAVRAPNSRVPLLLVALLAVAALLVGGLLWDRMARMQEQLARQSADSGASATEARVLASQAQAQSRDMAARLAVMEARLGELALQRAQLDELMQSLSRSRDENLVVDLESAIRLAQQQAQLTGSVEPLLAALRSAEQRLSRTPQPRLAPVQRALARDQARIKSTPVSDITALLLKLDELSRLVAQLPLANAVGHETLPDSATTSSPRTGDDPAPWWQRSLQRVRDELRALVRVSRIEDPESVLLSPEQSFFVRENLRLVLLSARLSLLARQPDAARAELATVAATLRKYFDPAARRTRAAVALLQQVQEQMQTLELPRADESLAALASAAGR